MPHVAQKLMHVPFPAECWLKTFSLFVCHAAFPRTNVTSLRSIHSLAWSWWRSMWSSWRRGRRLSRIMPNSWGRPRFLSLFSCAVCLKMLRAACVSVFAWVHAKRLFMKCLCGLMTTLGQNLACLWNTGLILQLQCARSSPRSLFRPTSGVVLSFAGEERKWEQTGTWEAGCGQRESERRKNSYFNVHSGLMFLTLLYKTASGCGRKV